MCLYAKNRATNTFSSQYCTCMKFHLVLFLNSSEYAIYTSVCTFLSILPLSSVFHFQRETVALKKARRVKIPSKMELNRFWGVYLIRDPDYGLDKKSVVLLSR